MIILQDRLRYYIFDDVSMYICKSHIAATEPERGTRVINAHQMQHGRV